LPAPRRSLKSSSTPTRPAVIAATRASSNVSTYTATASNAQQTPAPNTQARHASKSGPSPLTKWYCRAGWYAYDLFDNDDIPSAETILPEFQHLEIGQVLGEEGLTVRQIEPNRHLVLSFHYPKTTWVVKQGVWPHFGHTSACLQLKPLRDGQRTRLLYRMRYSGPAVARILMAFFEPADFLSSRKMLIGIKRRAETRSCHHTVP
jgi:hypothetical protein